MRRVKFKFTKEEVMKRFLVLILLTLSLSAEQNTTNQDILKSLAEDVASIFGSIKDNFRDKNSSLLKEHKRVTQPEPPQTLQPEPTPETTHPQTNEEVIPKEEQKLLKKMGIEITGSKISIDANKTRTFLEQFTKTIEKGLENGLKKAEKKMPKEDDLGVVIEDEKIEIDLNKTKGFMKKWIDVIGTFAKELDKSVEPLVEPLTK
jgi:hypothetical protein